MLIDPPILCFQDATLALLAQGSYFLIHKGFLARHSPVFADAFTNCVPIDYFCGKPVFEAHDSSKDMAFFLLALYDGSSHLKYDVNDFPCVSAVLRLATKYKVHRLRHDILQGLSVAWPRFLTQWEIREANATSPSGVYEPRKLLPHPILVINLARAVDAPYLLPSAFYDLSRCNPSDTVTGYKCPRTGETHYLSEEDLTNLLEGKEHASRFFSTFIVRELESRKPASDCMYKTDSDPLRSQHCQAAFEAITFDMIRDVNGIVYHRSSDPLFAIMDAELMQSREDLEGQYNVSMRVCHSCRSGFSAAVDNAREELWGKLPQWFGVTLQSWP